MLAPYPTLGLTALILFVVNLMAAYTLSQSPHPDVVFRVDEGVLWAMDGSNRIEAPSLEGEAGRIQLDPVDLVEEPDMLERRSAMNAFFDRQSVIVGILEGDDPTIATAAEARAVELVHRWFPTEIIFWIQLVVGNVGALIGIAVWTFQRENPAARYFGVTGVGLAISATAAAVYSSRPIGIEGDVFRLLSTINFSGMLLFCAGFLGMTWAFPKPLAARWLPMVWCALMLCVWLADVGEVFDDLALTRHLPPLVTLMAAAVLLTLQWRRSRGDALTRQSLRWFIFVTLGGSAAFVGLVSLPALFDTPRGTSQGVAFLAFLIIYLGIAVGVARYPLFDLQQYWLRTLPWLGAGIMVITLNLLLVSWFGFSLMTGLIMIAVSFAVLFLPTRALGAKLVFNRASHNFQQHLPLVVANISSAMSSEELKRNWGDQLVEIFRPISIESQSIRAVKPVVVRRGQGLVVPALDGAGSFYLEHADQGIRLFNSLDVSLLETLRNLFEMSESSIQAREEGTRAERRRLRQDLHDSLGSRLLTIMHSTSEPVVASESRQAMSELRDILAALDGMDTSASQVLERWHAQIQQQAQVFSVMLGWRQDPVFEDANLVFPGKLRLNVGRILTEGVTNAIRHAAARDIEVDFAIEDDALRLAIRNDGQFEDPEQWQAGFGLANIRERAAELGGSVEWQLDESKHMALRLTVPFDRTGQAPVQTSIS